MTLRDEALELLAAFVPHAGRTYAATRNFDRGPSDRSNVSMLSPYVRRRIVTEEEVLRAILARHTPSAAFKSVQEVLWRTYWKGWLEGHPATWTEYRADLEVLRASLSVDDELAERHRAAVEGRTGIPAFDAWARELRAHNYLHNHARMWFASIWIFTLLLPWELGADFFLQYLFDGDPASNTLSWRWVAGLQTPGKTYLARRANIARYTEGRLDGGDALATIAPAPRNVARPRARAIVVPEPQPESRDSAAGEAALLVVHEDDLGVDTLPCDALGIATSVAVRPVRKLSPVGVAPAVRAFRERAFAECATATTDVAGALEIARSRGLQRVIVPYAPVGPGETLVAEVAAACALAGLRMETYVRSFDRYAWPRATRGFFGFARSIPALLGELSIV